MEASFRSERSFGVEARIAVEKRDCSCSGDTFALSAAGNPGSEKTTTLGFSWATEREQPIKKTAMQKQNRSRIILFKKRIAPQLIRPPGSLKHNNQRVKSIIDFVA